jgi:hypothetical protein
VYPQNMASATHGTVILEKTEQAQIRSLVEAQGVRRAHAALGISRHAMERAAGGLTIQRGTAALLEQRLRSLGRDQASQS